MNMIKMNFHLFDVNTNVTTATKLSPEMKTFYDKVLLRSAEPELVHDQFGQKRPIPAGSGKKIEFRKFGTLGKLLTPLTEGVTPDGQSYEVTALEGEIKQYGGYVTMSDLLNLTAFDNNQAEVLKMLGSQAGRTSDTLTREVLAAGTQVVYANGSSRASVGKTNPLTIELVKKAVTQLKRHNAPKIGDSYVAIVHPDTVYDLWKDETWLEAQKYQHSEKIFKGEIGQMFGVRFVESTEAKVFEGAGASSANVYATLVLGADAFGVTSINGNGVETIVKQLGSSGVADALDQRSSVGWKMNKAVTILDNERMVRIEHGSTME